MDKKLLYLVKHKILKYYRYPDQTQCSNQVQSDLKDKTNNYQDQETIKLTTN